MSVTHYADADSEGVTFLDPMTIAPIPPLCDDGKEGDTMTFFISETTCPACLDAARNGGTT